MMNTVYLLRVVDQENEGGGKILHVILNTLINYA